MATVLTKKADGTYLNRSILTSYFEKNHRKIKEPKRFKKTLVCVVKSFDGSEAAFNITDVKDLKIYKSNSDVVAWYTVKWWSLQRMM